MSLWPAVTALAAVGALINASPARATLTRPHKARADPADTSLLRRLRVPLATLAGAAGWAFVGGLVGVLAGMALAALAWRTLSNARGPQAIRREQRLRADFPLVVELLAGAVAVGADVQTAMGWVAGAIGDPWQSTLRKSLHALQLGQAPASVWADLEADPFAAGLGRALSRSHAAGVPVVEAMRRLAHDLREDADLAAQASARTIEVRAAAPLGLCFLPAFVLLGVVPLVASILGDLSWVGAH